MKSSGHTRRASLAIVALGFVAIAPAGVAAQGATTDSARAHADSVRGGLLNTVVVSATRTTMTLQEMPLHTTVISQQDIQRSQAQTLDQLLREVPGMNMAGAPFYTTDPTGHQTRMRGVTNSTVLVLLDGIPVHDPFYTTTQWFKVPLSSIQRIEVLRGGTSSLWGSLAVSGVINIITKKPTDNSAQLDVNYESLNTSVASVAKDWLVRDDLGVRLSGDLLRTDGYQTTPQASLGAVPGKGPSSARNGNAELAAYYTPEGYDAFVRAGYHQQNEDIGGYQYGSNLQKSPDAAAGVTRHLGDQATLDFRVWTQYLSFDKYNGAGCFLASASNCNTTSTSAPLVQYANSHDTNPYHEVGASAVWSTTAGGRMVPNLQAGVDYRTVGGQDSATTFNKPTTTDISSSTINRVNFGKGTQWFVGGFTQLTAAPTDRLHATLSLRYDYWANEGGVAQLTRYSNGVPGAIAGGPVANTDKGKFDPSLSARYQLSSQLSLRGAAYEAFRAPGLNNLYRTFSSSTSITIANPNLSPETLTGGEVGADYQAHGLTLGATAFQYNTQNAIASYKIANAAAAPPAVVAICGATLANCPATVNFNTNGQNAISKGLELTGSVRATASVTLNAAYTYTDSHYTLTTTGDPTGVQLGAIPRHLETAGATWQATSRWSSYAEVRHSGFMYLDVNQTIPQSAFTLLNLSTSYQLTDRVGVYGAASNVTNVLYSDNATTSAASETLGMGRAFTGGVRWRF